MCIDKRLQCKSTYHVNQLWHVKRICSAMSEDERARLVELIQARANLLGEPIVNQEAYETAMRLLKEEAQE